MVIVLECRLLLLLLGQTHPFVFCGLIHSWLEKCCSCTENTSWFGSKFDSYQENCSVYRFATFQEKPGIRECQRVYVVLENCSNINN